MSPTYVDPDNPANEVTVPAVVSVDDILRTLGVLLDDGELEGRWGIDRYREVNVEEFAQFLREMAG